MLNERVEKADLYEIKNRIKYLRQIINRKIELKPGQMNWLNKPCEISDNVKNTGGKVKLLGEGAYGKVLEVCIDQLCKNEFVLKEVKYRKEEFEFLDQYNPYRSENIEIKIFRLLNDLVYIGATPHIPLYMGDFRCDINNEHYRYIMIEKADGTLEDIFTKKPSLENMKNILFQLLYTLKIIQKRYDDFIYNDLKPNNVLYFNINDPKNNMYYKYELDGIVYYLPNSYRIAFWDFGLSSIRCAGADNLIVEKLISEQKLGIQTEKNHYKDVFKFFTYLKAYNNFIDKETISFIDRYTYKTEDKDQFWNLIPNIEPFTIEEILADSYFDLFRINKISDDKIIESYSDENVYNMELTRFAGISDIRDDLKFNCDSYKKYNIRYFAHKIPSHDNPYRIDCLPSSDNTVLSENDKDFLSVVCGQKITTEDEYKSVLINSGKKYIEDFNRIKPDNIDKIIDIFTDLFIQFVRYMYVKVSDKRIISNILRIVILNKAVFIQTKKHYTVSYIIKHNDEKYSKYLDYVVQFNEFLCHDYIK